MKQACITDMYHIYEVCGIYITLFFLLEINSFFFSNKKNMIYQTWYWILSYMLAISYNAIIIFLSLYFNMRHLKDKYKNTICITVTILYCSTFDYLFFKRSLWLFIHTLFWNTYILYLHRREIRTPDRNTWLLCSKKQLKFAVYMCITLCIIKEMSKLLKPTC